MCIDNNNNHIKELDQELMTKINNMISALIDSGLAEPNLPALKNPIYTKISFTNVYIFQKT